MLGYNCNVANSMIKFIYMYYLNCMDLDQCFSTFFYYNLLKDSF